MILNAGSAAGVRAVFSLPALGDGVEPGNLVPWLAGEPLTPATPDDSTCVVLTGESGANRAQLAASVGAHGPRVCLLGALLFALGLNLLVSFGIS